MIVWFTHGSAVWVYVAMGESPLARVLQFGGLRGSGGGPLACDLHFGVYRAVGEGPLTCVLHFGVYLAVGEGPLARVCARTCSPRHLQPWPGHMLT